MRGESVQSPPATRFNSTPSSDPVSLFTLWQLADSAFPTGGFAHSGGLEAAWQHGEVRNRAELISFLEASLRQIARAALPFVGAAYEEPERLAEFDQLCDAFTSNHVANRASRAQGRALLSAVERVFNAGLGSASGAAQHQTKFSPLTPALSPLRGEGVATGAQHDSETRRRARAPLVVAHDQTSERGVQAASRHESAEAPNAARDVQSAEAACRAPSPLNGVRGEAILFAHLPPVFGSMMRRLDVPRETVLRLFVFNHLRGAVAAAVRLNIVGPMEGQSIQHQLSAQAEAVVQLGAVLTLDDLAQTAPLPDLWQGAQDRLYSRLFQS